MNHPGRVLPQQDNLTNPKSAVFQLEDDVIAKNGYYNDMKAFTKQDANNQWLYVEFSQLGFIGAYSNAAALLETAGQMIQSSSLHVFFQHAVACGALLLPTTGLVFCRRLGGEMLCFPMRLN